MLWVSLTVNPQSGTHYNGAMTGVVGGEGYVSYGGEGEKKRKEKKRKEKKRKKKGEATTSGRAVVYEKNGA